MAGSNGRGTPGRVSKSPSVSRGGSRQASLSPSAERRLERLLDAGQLQPSTSLPATAGGNSNEVPIDPQLGSLVGEQDPYFGFEEAALVQALGQGDPQSSSSVNTGSSVPPAASSPNSAVTWEQLLASSPQNDQQHAGQYLAPSERFEPQQPQQQSGPQQGGDNPSTVGVTDQTAQQSSRPSFQQQQDVQQQGAEEQDDQEFERLLAEYCNFPEDMGQLSEPQQPQQAAAQTPEATQEVSPEAKDEVSPEAKEEVSPRAPATTRAPVATGEQQVAPQPPENSRPPTSPESEDREGGVQVRTGEQVVTTAYSSVRIDSVLCKRLAREPARREPIQRRPGQVLNTGRRSNVEALLAHVTGQVAGEACKNCRKEHGPWTQCVVYSGQMCGSCSNCWFNASGARCSFRAEQNTPPAAQQQAAQQQASLQQAALQQAALQRASQQPVPQQPARQQSVSQQPAPQQPVFQQAAQQQQLQQLQQQQQLQQLQGSQRYQQQLQRFRQQRQLQQAGQQPLPQPGQQQPQQAYQPQAPVGTPAARSPASSVHGGGGGGNNSNTYSAGQVLAAEALQQRMSAASRQAILRGMNTMSHASRNRRHMARIEAAAVELSARVFAYEEYMRSPEGRADALAAAQAAARARSPSQPADGDDSLMSDEPEPEPANGNGCP